MTKLTPEATIRAALEALPTTTDVSWQEWADADDAFLAACSPTNITALLAELDAARTRADEAESWAARYLFLRDKAWGEYGALALLPPDKMDAAIDHAILDSALAQSAASRTPASDMRGSE